MASPLWWGVAVLGFLAFSARRKPSMPPGWQEADGTGVVWVGGDQPTRKVRWEVSGEPTVGYSWSIELLPGEPEFKKHLLFLEWMSNWAMSGLFPTFDEAYNSLVVDMKLVPLPG